MGFADQSDAFANEQNIGDGQANLSNQEISPIRRSLPTLSELKLLIIASTGFFIDAYDLFAINLVVPVLNAYYNRKKGGTLKGATLNGGLLKAAANLGCVVGQVGFGLMSDVFGRKTIYPLSLIIAIIGVTLTIAVPTSFSAKSAFAWITVWRVFMGVGIGGDYPMSASVVSDRANLNRRGLLLSLIFSAQGWGNLAGGLVALIVLAAFRDSIHNHQKYSHFNAVWRIIVGVILIPCLGTLYQRITLPESARMKAALELRKNPHRLHQQVSSNGKEDGSFDDPKGNNTQGDNHGPVDNAHAETGTAKGALAAKSGAFHEAVEYFSEWRHLKNLIATAGCWFLVDITFYGISLNQSIVVDAIGYSKRTELWNSLFDNTKANLIITVAGFLPGYYVTMLTVEWIGRKPIQIGGFLLEALFLMIVAGDFNRLKHHSAGFVVCFALLQFFFNFGANATTFLYPAEVFPTRIRGVAHGFSAACGKCGAVLASLVFSIAATDIGTDNTLWIFGGISILGAALSLLLPEVKGTDPDLIDHNERVEKARARGY